MLRHLPNILTLSRILAIPVIILLLYVHMPVMQWAAIVLFALASFTDFFDGYLARIWSVQSNIGRFLDPIADKLLVASIIVVLVHLDCLPGWNVIPALAIVCREILVSGLREFLAQIDVYLPVSPVGKIKTAFQFVALFGLLVFYVSQHAFFFWVGILSLWFAAILTLLSGYIYLRAGLDHMDIVSPDSNS